jgi:anaerobic nitric oxide reductase transcription regulator
MGISLWLDQQIWGVLTLDALNAGQFDHLNQPALQTFIALTEASIKAAQWIMGLETQVKQVQQTLLTEASRWEIVGKSPIIQALREEIAVVAPSELSVLILGETGVGKELVAHQIHATSHRANQPLIYVNCAALPETIAESELFGHRKGSFSGAIQDRSGKFELAHRGTIFLDEIGELPLALQAKILRTLQNGEIQRVGCDRQIKVDIRVIAATNRHLQESVAKGLFRPDLYHRLAVYPLTVPPLKQRGQDILLLAGLFLEKNKQRLGVQGLRLEIEAKNALLNYSWPGNIRELEHLLSRAALKAVAEHEKNKTIISISLKHLDIDIQNLFDTDLMIKNNPIVDQTLNFKAQRDEFSRQLIQQQLALHQHNLAKTAYALGLNPGNFHRLLKRLHLL